MDEVLQTPLEVWTGLVRTQGASTVLCLAHRQHAMLQGIEFEKDRLVALYNMKKVFDENSATWCLQWQTDSIYVFIPEENEVIPWCVKEVCAGMGGIGQGLEAIGFNRVAALDCNPLMCDTLKQNGIPGVDFGGCVGSNRQRCPAPDSSAHCDVWLHQGSPASHSQAKGT